MNDTAALPPNSSLTALRGAVCGVVGAGDALGRWDQVVWLWRIVSALDGLMAALWAIVYRLRAGEVLVGGVGPAEAVVRGARAVVAGSGLVRRRAGVRAVADRRVLTGAAAGGVPCGAWPQAGWGCRDRGLGGVSPVLAVRGRLFSELGWGASRSCVLIVPV